MKVFWIFTNKIDGLSSSIATGNESYYYRCIFKDTDADETVSVLFSNDLDRLISKAKDFTGKNYYLSFGGEGRQGSKNHDQQKT